MKGRKRLIKKKRCTSHLKRQYSKLMLARLKGPFNQIFDAFLSSRNEKVRETVHLGSRSNILSKNKCSKISLHCLFKRLTFCIRISKWNEWMETWKSSKCRNLQYLYNVSNSQSSQWPCRFDHFDWFLDKLGQAAQYDHIRYGV